ncbi:hypothetical protein Adt_14832 [Abeliophyllum distichum]|uniref:Uncharacterized protein n=1 Tax=Abeliophyllum distichum TaxID=126358 RepID=A0ABD1U1U4_9LAMI
MGKTQPPEFNTPMIYCSHPSPTTEETHSWQPNNKPTRTSLAQAPLPLGLGNRSCSIPRSKPRFSASTSGTRHSLLFHSKEQDSLKRLSHWDSAFALVPFKGTRLAQAPLPLGLGIRSCSIQRNKPRSSTTSTGTRHSLLFHSKEQDSLKRLSHWDSAFALVPFKGTSLALAPLPLGLGVRSCSIQKNKPHSIASPLGLGIRSCSIQRNKPRSSATPTGTRHSPCSIQRNKTRSSASPTGTRR